MDNNKLRGNKSYGSGPVGPGSLLVSGGWLNRLVLSAEYTEMGVSGIAALRWVCTVGTTVVWASVLAFATTIRRKIMLKVIEMRGTSIFLAMMNP